MFVRCQHISFANECSQLGIQNLQQQLKLRINFKTFAHMHPDSVGIFKHYVLSTNVIIIPSSFGDNDTACEFAINMQNRALFDSIEFLFTTEQWIQIYADLKDNH